MATESKLSQIDQLLISMLVGMELIHTRNEFYVLDDYISISFVKSLSELYSTFEEKLAQLVQEGYIKTIDFPYIQFTELGLKTAIIAHRKALGLDAESYGNRLGLGKRYLTTITQD